MNRYETIRRLAAKNGLSHAYLITGENEAERTGIALFLAQAMNCRGTGEKPCGVCRDCRKTAAHTHPDVITVERRDDRRELVVDQIRELSRECYVVPNEGLKKIFLLPEADKMNPSAQNALLKLLEEPPSYAAFLLLGVNPGSFLPTIRSRCVAMSVETTESGARDSRAEALADAFVSGDSLSLAKQCFRLEKADRDSFDLFVDALYAAAVRRAVSGSGAAVRLAELAETLREMRARNVSAGHCLGLIMSGQQSAVGN